MGRGCPGRALNRIGRGTVEAGGLVVGVVVAEIGADDDQGVFIRSERFKHPGHLVSLSPANQQGNNGEPAQDHLKERKLNLERVIATLGAVLDSDVPMF